MFVFLDENMRGGCTLLIMYHRNKQSTEVYYVCSLVYNLTT